MNKYWYKLMIMTLAAVMIVTTAKPANALIPLPSLDFGRISGTITKTMNQVMEIKNEIMSNYEIIQDLQRGGYGAAAGKLFAKVENGDYDRLTGNIKGFGESMKVSAMEVEGFKEAQKECKKKAKEFGEKMQSELEGQCKDKEGDEAKKCMADIEKSVKKAMKKEIKSCEKEMNAQTGKKIAEYRLANQKKAADKAAKLNDENNSKATFNRFYNTVKGANVSGAINTLNNGGSFGNVVSQFGNSAGAIVGGTSGSDAGKVLGGMANVVGGASNVIGQGGDARDVITNTLNNSNINNGLNSVRSGVDEHNQKIEQRNQQIWQSFNNSVEENNKAMAEEQKQREEQQNQQIMDGLRQGVMQSMTGGN